MVGTYQKLKVLYKMDFGYFLGNEGDEKGILLPIKQVPKGTNVGDEMEVFIYRDSDDRIIATTKRPLAALGEVAMMKVRETSRIGAFLDWGMDKDLFLPFAEQTAKVAVGDEVMAAVYTDKSGRLCATMKVSKKLRTDSPYRKGDEVKAVVYGIKPDLGVFAAVDGAYSALLPKQAICRRYKVGQTYPFFVSERRDDGRLTLSEVRSAYVQMDIDADRIMRALDEYGGEFPFGESISPDMVRREFAMSKAAFKRALGRLFAEHRIMIEEDRIRKTDKIEKTR